GQLHGLVAQQVHDVLVRAEAAIRDRHPQRRLERRLVGERVSLLVFLERLFVIPLTDQDVPPAQLIVIGILLVLSSDDRSTEHQKRKRRDPLNTSHRAISFLLFIRDAKPSTGRPRRRGVRECRSRSPRPRTGSPRGPRTRPCRSARRRRAGRAAAAWPAPKARRLPRRRRRRRPVPRAAPSTARRSGAPRAPCGCRPASFAAPPSAPSRRTARRSP